MVANTAAVAAADPAIQSPMRPPAPTGASPGTPRPSSEPHQACSVNSVAARFDQGPPRPNAEIDTSDVALKERTTPTC